MAKQTPQEKRKQQLIDELIADYDGPESFWGESGLFADLKKRIVERTLDAEMDDHLGYTKHNPKGNNSGNSRNGRGKRRSFSAMTKSSLPRLATAMAAMSLSLSPRAKSISKVLTTG